MAHFAQIDSNNIVKNVIVISNEMLHNSEGIEVEQIGIDFCKSLKLFETACFTVLIF